MLLTFISIKISMSVIHSKINTFVYTIDIWSLNSNAANINIKVVIIWLFNFFRYFCIE